MFPSRDVRDAERERRGSQTYRAPGSGRSGTWLRVVARYGVDLASSRLDLGVANTAPIMTRLRMILRYKIKFKNPKIYIYLIT